MSILPPVDSRPRCLHRISLPAHPAIFARLHGDALLDFTADCFCRFDLRSQEGLPPASSPVALWSLQQGKGAQARVRLCHFLSGNCRAVLVPHSFSQIWFCSSAIVVRFITGGFSVLFLSHRIKMLEFFLFLLTSYIYFSSMFTRRSMKYLWRKILS
jgi:hypothetical protein